MFHVCSSQDCCLNFNYLLDSRNLYKIILKNLSRLSSFSLSIFFYFQIIRYGNLVPGFKDLVYRFLLPKVKIRTYYVYYHQIDDPLSEDPDSPSYFIYRQIFFHSTRPPQRDFVFSMKSVWIDIIFSLVSFSMIHSLTPSSWAFMYVMRY
jgi:hypothetical protein